MKHIVHLHSSEDGRLPDPRLLENGEIAVNNASGNEGLFIKNTDGEIVKVAGDSNFSINTEDLSYKSATGPGYYDERETANSYVINEPGYYKFPLVYGNAITGDATNSAAYTNGGGTYQAAFVNYNGNQITSPYIETDTGETGSSAEVLIADEDNIISNVEIISDSPCRFIRFRVLRVPENGANAVIGLYDGNDNIMWSWHIWLWRESLKPVEIINHEENSYKIMPINLGSKYDSTGHLINWFYQWGRKDPMLLPEAYNSNTNHASYGSLSYSIENCASSVSLAINNPCTFYKYGGNYGNWTSQINYFFNFWDATCNATGYTEKTVVKTVYDPCPRGFCVPNARVFTGFTTTGENTGESSEFNINGSWNSGWNFKTAAGGSVFFPASGGRNYYHGTLYDVGGSGYCWSAGAAGESSASRLYFGSGYVNPLGSYNRSCGFSVRPAAI